MPAKGVRLHAATLVGYLCVALATAWPLPMYLSTALPGSPGGDTGVYVWNLWVFRHEIVAHSHFPFFTREILAVGPTVPLTLHNYTSFANLLAFPLLPWLGTVATFNVLLIANGVASAYAMFLFARARLADAAAAWIAGLLFGFSPFMSARATEHFSLVQAAPLPIFALLLYRVWVHPTMKLAVAAGVVVAWAYLCDPYYAVYCLLMAAFTVAASAIALERSAAPGRLARHTMLLDLALILVGGLILGIVLRGGGQLEIFGLRVSVRRLYNPVMVFTVLALIRVWILIGARITFSLRRLPPLRVAAAAAIGCAALLAPVLYAMSTTVGHRQWIGPTVHWRSSAPGVDLLALFAPNPLHPLFGEATRAWIGSLPNGFVENVASIPWIAMGTLAVAVLWKRLRVPKAWIGWTSVFVILALGPFVRIAGETMYIPGPWALLRYVPVVGAARMPTRFTVLVMLCVAMLLGLAVRHLRERSARPRLIAGVIGALLIFEMMPAPRVLHSARVPSFFSIVAEDPRPLRVLQLPFGIRDGLSSRGNFSAIAQFFQTVHEKPLVGGYLSRLPNGEVERFRKVLVLRVLMRLSEERRVEPELRARALQSAAHDAARLRIGYVVVQRTQTSDELLQFAQEAFTMRLVAKDGEWELYSTAALVNLEAAESANR
jgi:hypothetical protein